MVHRLCSVAAVLLLLRLSLPAAGAENQRDQGLTIARAGQPLISVTTDEQADPAVVESATTLAQMLSRIIGQPVSVGTGASTAAAAIHLQISADLSAGAADPRLAADRYRFQTSSHRLLIQGATSAAVRHAVWDVLHRLGHRQYFPHADWEITPRAADLSLNLNETVEPSYLSRTIFFGWGLWGYNNEPFRQWMQRNRMDGGFRLARAHAYQDIVRRHKASFDADPDMLALVNGKRTGDKLCISNPRLQQLVINDGVAQFRGGAECISLEPSDGSGWCECDKCAALGNVSDRAVLLVNLVAEAARKEGLNPLIGMNAYHMHSVPPARLKPDPALIVTVTTRFLNAGLSFDQVVASWQAAGLQRWGVRDYPSIFTNDLGLPGRGTAANPRLFAQRLATYHEKGARFYNGESSDSWAAQGLGYYVMSRVLWDVREAQRVDAIIDEFVTNCFPDAIAPMRDFYQRVNGSEPSTLSEDLVARMYRDLQTAFSQARLPETRRRLVQMAFYTRYTELILRSRLATNAAQRDELAVETLRLSFRAKDAMLLHTKALHRKMTTIWPGFKSPDNVTWRTPAEKSPLKPTEPVTEAEALAWVEQGVAANKMFDGPTRAFSDELVPAPRLLELMDANPTPASAGPATPPVLAGRGNRTYWTWIPAPKKPLRLIVTGGLIGRDKGPVRIELHAAALEEPVANMEIPADKQPHEITLISPNDGLHRVELADRGGGTRIQWLEPQHVTYSLDFENPTGHNGGRYDAVFYVPKGTRALSVFIAATTPAGALVAPDGRKALLLTDGPRFHKLDLMPGDDGKLWKIDNLLGTSVRLLNVPVQVAPSVDALLLPAEVVRQDSLQQIP